VKLSTKEIIHMARLILDYEMEKWGREFDLGFQHAFYYYYYYYYYCVEGVYKR